MTTTADIARSKINEYPVGHQFTNEELAQDINRMPTAIHSIYPPMIKAGQLSCRKKSQTRIFTKLKHVPLVHKYGKKRANKLLKIPTLFSNFSEAHYQFAYGGTLRSNDRLANFSRLGE